LYKRQADFRLLTGRQEAYL